MNLGHPRPNQSKLQVQQAQFYRTLLLCLCVWIFFFFFAQNLDKQQPLAEGLFKYVMMLPPAYEKAVNSEDFDR